MKKEFRVYTTKEVKEDIKKTWSEISDYLNLNLSWNGLVKATKRKYKGGFVIAPNKKGWGIICEKKKKLSKVTFNFKSPLSPKEIPRYQLGHELVHLYRMVFIGEFFMKSRLIDLFEEAYAEGVSVKSIKNKRLLKRLAFLRKTYYASPEIAMISELLYKLKREDLIRYLRTPQNEKEAQAIFKETLKLLRKANQAKWLKQFLRKKDLK